MHRIRLLAAIAFFFSMIGVVALRPESAAAFSCSPCPATATADVNLLAEPSPSSPVLSVIPSGATLEWDGLQGTVDGFVAVSYDGADGWADPANLLLFPLFATTTADLNLYADPSLEAEIRAEIPAGTDVMVLGGPENGFFTIRIEVELNAIAGWALADSLAIDERPDAGDVDTLPTTGAGTTAGTRVSTSLVGIAILGMLGAVALSLKERRTR